MHSEANITRRLIDSRNGDEKALNEVFGEVYESLRSIAHNQLGRNRYGNTLNTTALVHEAYERLVGNTSLEIQDRTHFFSIASRAMRFVLVDYARSQSAGKRGGRPGDLTLDPTQLQMEERSADLVNLDEALSRLMEYDDKLGKLVELRFFGGLTYEEISKMEGRSVRTVKRDWQRARAWILWAMKPDGR
jgi:RNA polymerase sigma factor (TIGR02999 family)